jgi:hypothetical protein
MCECILCRVGNPKVLTSYKLWGPTQKTLFVLTTKEQCRVSPVDTNEQHLSTTIFYES